jgi:hypothetical protein
MKSARQIESFRWPHWLSPVALLLVSWVGVAALTLQPRPDSDVVAVIFPPWWSAAQSFSAAASAGAAIVRAGAMSSILIVRPAESEGLLRLRDAGAWFAIDPQAVSACFTR